MQQEGNVIRLNAKDVLKLSKTDFIVKYGDGTQHEVNEGILIEANPDNSVTFHNGTDRPEVLFAATFALFEAISRFGLTESYGRYFAEEMRQRGQEPKKEGE